MAITRGVLLLYKVLQFFLSQLLNKLVYRPLHTIGRQKIYTLREPSIERVEGSFLSATFDSMETAALVSVPFDLTGIMMSGIYINLATARPYFSWLRFISGFYYGTECISILQWDVIDTINCVNIPGIPCIRTGSDVLTRFGYDGGNFWRNCFCLGVMYCVGNLVAYLMVVRRSKDTPVY